MVEVGHACVTLVDRWQHTALDDARRFGAAEVVSFLEDSGSRQLSTASASIDPVTPGGASPRRGSRSSVKERFAAACLAGQLATVQRLLLSQRQVPSQDPAGRLTALDITAGLLAAAVKGHEVGKSR